MSEKTPLSIFSSPSDRPCLPEVVLPGPARKRLREMPIGWLGDDGRNVFLEVQGQCVCVAVRKGPMVVKPALRGTILTFSSASRLRLLKLVNRLDWTRAGRCSFLTMTWRDALGRPEPERLTQARSDFHRRVEARAGKKVAGLWRVEWEVRLTGRYRGQYMPHAHEILYDVPKIGKDWVEEAWSKVIGCPGMKVRTHIREIKNLRQCMYYVAKYIGKADAGDLVIPSYLNKYLCGRKWGKYRADLLPLADKTEMRVAPGELVEEIRRIAREQWDKVPECADQGFTIFGPAAAKISALIDRYCLDDQRGGDRIGVRSEGTNPAERSV